MKINDIHTTNYFDTFIEVAEKYEEARRELFSKGQACMRSSPLTKRYGWGVHCNHEGKIAIFGPETEAYQKFLSDSKIKKVKAMRTKKTNKQ